MSDVTTITVEVRDDHLETLARTKPMTALAELVWNALDAEATEVRVVFEENELGGLEQIVLLDDGAGLHHEDALTVFRNLGGSWKRAGTRANGCQRELHGKYGKGRFRAFSLGHDVTWHSVYEENGDWFEYTISGQGSAPGVFRITAPKPSQAESTGMTVRISNPFPAANLLRGVKANQEATDTFALYLRHYPDTRIHYDNTPLDSTNAERSYVEYELPSMVMENGERVEAKLSVVEWNLPGKRGLYLCDADGFMRAAGLPRLHFRGFSYTAYLKSAHVTQLDQHGMLSAGELSNDVRQLLDVARRKLREHFTLREAERAKDTIEDWKEHGLYPYLGEAKNEQEAAERKIFEIYATHLDQISPDFATANTVNKRLILQLIQELVRSQPTRVARILDGVVEFPEFKEAEILELVQG
ncbi:MAG: hypothetical protein RLZZ303_495 [Candidatus Hydrogenedentota bacterium]|jgi:hypothetical protein